jgi:hypothetical protein
VLAVKGVAAPRVSAGAAFVENHPKRPDGPGKACLPGLLLLFEQPVLLSAAVGYGRVSVVAT